MAEDYQDYKPSGRFDNVQHLLGNHFKFVIDSLPDLTFFAQSITLPELSAGVAERPTPFTTIPEVGDHLQFGSLQVAYLVDNAFKSYFSLFYWLKGYGFPKSYQDVLDFNESRKNRLGNPRPIPREIQKTNATLYILTPANDTTIVEIGFEDLYPTAIGQLTFDTTEGDAPQLHTQATFRYTDFDVRLKS